MTVSNPSDPKNSTPSEDPTPTESAVDSKDTTLADQDSVTGQDAPQTSSTSFSDLLEASVEHVPFRSNDGSITMTEDPIPELGLEDLPTEVEDLSLIHI